MSGLVRRMSPYAAWVLTHPGTREVRRGLAEAGRRLRREPHRVRYFHQVDDPYSQLAAQVLGELEARYHIQLEPCLVGPPPDDAAPERERLGAFSRKDAAEVAGAYGLVFPSVASAPEMDRVSLASRLLTASIASGDFVSQAALVGEALWRDAGKGLEDLATRGTPADPGAAEDAIRTGTALRAKLGHYLGAMFHYGGEWYWGVERLRYLERRLQGLGALRPGASSEPIVVRPDFASEPPPRSSRRLRLEFFPSLRSPYTAIAMERVLALPERLPVELVLRPVLPMVMRGLPLPRAKRLYIVLDTKREAEEAGVPFGFACNPVGRPVERAFSLFPWARERGRGAELIACFMRASFAEGVDTGEDEGLRRVVEAAGLAWDEAREHVDGEGWREELEDNRRALLEHGLWGVPSFRLIGEHGESDYCTWGQDRIWRVEQEIRARLPVLE